MGEQLFSELHRRHPDVDLVLLPPPAPLPDEPEVTDEHLAATAIDVAETCRSVWTAVAPDAVPTSGPVVRWTFAADPGRVRVVARVVDHRADGDDLLAGVERELRSRGWAVRRPRGAVARVVGRLDEQELTASSAPRTGAFVLAVSSQPLVVGTERATALAGRRRRVVEAGGR